MPGQPDDPFDDAPQRDDYLPRLDHALLADDEALHEVIGDVIAADGDARDHGERLAHYVRMLGPLLEENESELLDRVLAEGELRADAIATAVARWAEEGRQPASPGVAEPGHEPRLSAATVANRSALWAAIDRVLRGDAELRALSQLALAHEARVKTLVDRRAWRQIVEWETALVDCSSAIQRTLVAWAFRQGLREGRGA